MVPPDISAGSPAARNPGSARERRFPLEPQGAAGRRRPAKEHTMRQATPTRFAALIALSGLLGATGCIHNHYYGYTPQGMGATGCDPAPGPILSSAPRLGGRVRRVAAIGRDGRASQRGLEPSAGDQPRGEPGADDRQPTDQRDAIESLQLAEARPAKPGANARRRRPG